MTCKAPKWDFVGLPNYNGGLCSVARNPFYTLSVARSLYPKPGYRWTLTAQNYREESASYERLQEAEEAGAAFVCEILQQEILGNPTNEA